MGKSDKKKKSSGPPYKKPKEKFLVVTSPWSRNKEGIAAWFAIMLKDHYPDASVDAIYSQKDSDDTMIIKLPREVEDISYFLGAHIHSVFLTDRPGDTKVSYVYEYDYERHNDPAIKFHEYFPNNAPVPNPQYAHIKIPYPPPVIEITPPPYVVYAKAISSAMKEQVAARMAAAPPPPLLPPPPPQASTSRTTLEDNSPKISGIPPLPTQKLADPAYPKPIQKVAPATTDPRLAYRQKYLQEKENSANAVQVKKIDPYEQAEQAEHLLQSPMKQGTADEFLDCLFPSVKAEETPLMIKREDGIALQEPDPRELEQNNNSEDNEYKPSAELLAAFASLTGNVEEGPEVQVKPEPVDVEIPDYEPSSELLSAFSAFLPEPAQQHVQHIKEEYENLAVRVKMEPNEDSSSALSLDDLPGSAQLPRRSQTLDEKHLVSATDSVRIKPEPEDFPLGFHSMHNQRPQVTPTRDPRIRPQHVLRASATSRKREGDAMDQGHAPPKRIKAEPRD